MILCYASKTTHALILPSSTYGSIVGIRSSTSLFKVAMGSPLQLAMPSISPNFWQRFTGFGRPFPTWQCMCACPYLSRGFSIPSMYLGTLVVCLDSLNAYPTHSKRSGALASRVPLRVLRVAARHSVDICDFFRNLEHFVHSAVMMLSAASCSHSHGSPSTGLHGIVHRSCGRPSCRMIDPSAHSALMSNISIFHRLS